MKHRTVAAAIVILGVLGLLAMRGLNLPSPNGLWSASSAPRRQRRPFYAVPGTELTLARVIGREHGRRAWEFRAVRIWRSLDGLTVEAEKIEDGRFYQGDQVTLAFSAGRVKYEVLRRRLHLSGGFTGRLSDGSTLAAGTVFLDLGRRTLEIPGPVTLTGKDLNLAAGELAADLDGETVSLRDQVTVHWSGGTIAAEEVVYCVKDGTFTVRGGRGGVELTL